MSHVAYCGLKCDRCPVYIATVERNADAMARLASEYSTPECEFAPSDMVCMGCRSEAAARSKMCASCEVRLCAFERALGADSCAKCPDYPCSLIEKYAPEGSEQRAALDEMK